MADLIASIWAKLADLQNQLNRLRSLQYRAEIAGGVSVYTVADLPIVASRGFLAYASNGRKTGEGVGSGTGVLCYYDNVAWRRVDDGTTVQA